MLLFGDDHPHVEKAKGNSAQNRDYCTKEGDFWEVGERPLTQKEKGATEIDRYNRAWDMAKQGQFEEIDGDIRIRCYTTLKMIRKDYMEKPSELQGSGPFAQWIYGVAGVGKSRRAREENPDAYLKPMNKWWDGYQFQECVILDDVDPRHEWLPYFLKMWADRYPFIGEIKGGALYIRPKKFVVTSQYSIEECFPEQQTREALNRRFTSIQMGEQVGMFVDGFVHPSTAV
jgi:hypothetical protein